MCCASALLLVVEAANCSCRIDSSSLVSASDFGENCGGGDGGRRRLRRIMSGVRGSGGGLLRLRLETRPNRRWHKVQFESVRQEFRRLGRRSSSDWTLAIWAGRMGLEETRLSL